MRRLLLSLVLFSAFSKMTPASAATLYSVYPGCKAPVIDTLTDLYVDPVNGLDTNTGTLALPRKTIPKLVGGEHVHLMPGKHAPIVLTTYNAAQLVAKTKWIWFDLMLGAVVDNVDLRGMKEFLITGGQFGTVEISDSSQMIFNKIKITSGKPLTMTAAEWIALGDGFSQRNGSCVALTDSKISVIRNGLVFSSDFKTYPENSLKSLAHNNNVQDFSGDASRGIGSDISIRSNSFKKGHVSDADGDGNHDDMFQGFALNGAIFENILIENNVMIDRVSASQTLNNEYQGISVFDGLYRKVVIRGNVVVGGAYHGISLLWSEDSIIENNTVVSNNPVAQKYWVGFFNGKAGEPPVRAIMRNNLANYFQGTTLATSTNNCVVVSPKDEYVAFDTVNGVYDFHLKSTSPCYGRGAGAKK